MTTQLFPEVIDGSTLDARVGNSIFLPIGVEGQSGSDGSVAINVVKVVERASQAVDYFGATSPLTVKLKNLLARGAGPIRAIASAKGVTPPILTARQAAWQALEASRTVRIRLTDDTASATLAALATSCDNAALLNHKQFALAGLASGTNKAALITAAGAVNSKRLCLVGPGVYDAAGVLQSGSYLADCIASMLAVNNDPSDDLDTAVIPNLTDVERDANSNQLLRQIVVAGTVQNDFEDLLQAGFSPVMLGPNGVAITHLRTSFVDTAGTWDALMTRIIVDQLFIMIRDAAMAFNSLRKGNTLSTRQQLQSRIDALLKANADIVQPVVLGDGSTGYGVTVDADASNRQQIISYQGQVVRGTQTVLVDGNLTISA